MYLKAVLPGVVGYSRVFVTLILPFGDQHRQRLERAHSSPISRSWGRDVEILVSPRASPRVVPHEGTYKSHPDHAHLPFLFPALSIPMAKPLLQIIQLLIFFFVQVAFQGTGHENGLARPLCIWESSLDSNEGTLSILYRPK